MALYAELIGPPEHGGDSLRRFFLGPCKTTARGVFKVTCGGSLLARLVNRLLGFPSAGSAVPLQLTILREGDLEYWQRDFQGCRLESVQYRVANRWVAERHGLIELLFRLEFHEGALVHVQERTCLRLGLIRIAVPRWLAPKASGVTENHGSGDGLRASVRMTFPWGGLILAYEGIIESDG